MALSFTMKQTTLANTKTKVDEALKKMSLPSFASVSWQGDELCVKIEKGGKSEFRLAFKQNGDDVKIAEGKRDISMFHKPFVGKVEGVVDQLMKDAGAAKA